MSRTFLPDADKEIQRIQKRLSRRQRLIIRMVKFSKEVQAADCAGISGQGEKVQFKHLHKDMKRKGGHAPKDYTAVEMLIDFKKYVAEGQWDEAMPYYFGLRRMLGWD